jgi:hypothetical protein
MLILQVALLGFIACGVVAIVTVYVVRSRKVSYRQEIDPYLGSLSQMGVVPPTPLPEWAYWTESEQSDTPGGPPPIPR